MNFKVVGLGEVLWDLLPDGPQLGGAPANFAYHAHALGAQAAVVSRVGNDDFGRCICERFNQLGFLDHAVQVDETAPTGTVAVTFQAQGVPRFEIHDNVAWDRLQVNQTAIETVQDAHALCFGTLAQRDVLSRAAIRELLAASPPSALRVFDVNLRQNFYTREVIEQSFRLANVLKLNDDELPVLARMFGAKGSRRSQLDWLAQTFDLPVVALTCGPNGSLLYQRGQWSEQSNRPVQIVDTVGAGDAFTAALVMGLLHQLELRDLHALAAEVAGYVCSQAGATPALPDEFRRRLECVG